MNTPICHNSSSYRELTLVALIFGVVQGIILNVAFTYTALKLGFSIGGSAIASITGYALLRGLLRKGTIVENNINQTVASGINSAGIGVVFVLPAAFLLGVQNQAGFSFWPLLLAGIGGSILGVVLIIPLRSQLIEHERLRFPTGVAVAGIIRSGAAGADKAKILFVGCLIGGIWKLLLLSGWLDVPGLLEHEELNFGLNLLPAYVAPYLYLSSMNLAAGMLAGRGGLPFFAGGILAWWILSPATVWLGWTPAGVSGDALAVFIHKEMLRPLGIGMLIGAACMELINNYPIIKQVLTVLARAKSSQLKAKCDELPLQVSIIGCIFAVILLFSAAYVSPGVTLTQALVTAFLSTLWMGLAGLIVAQATGLTDISPISGISLVSVTILMVLLNNNVAAALLLAVAISVAIGQAADMMQDLKTGFLVGSRPVRQQLVQFATSWLGIAVSVGAIVILWYGGGTGQPGFGPDTPLPAPQATALVSVVDGVTNDNVPTGKFIMGGIIGMLFGAAPIAGLGVLVGLAMYLPFSITLGYGLGCLLQMWVARRKGHTYAENKLVPLAAGLIIGEALLSVGHAGYTIFSGGGG